MRRFCWQRWTPIFLLMARLVIGELGHAMPMAAMSPLEPTTVGMAGDPACAEHDSGGMAHQDDVSNDAGTHSGGEHDCCKSGDCECPCLHLPCVALDAAVLSPVSLALLSIPHGAETVTSLRPSRLFRPPA
ncbi:CopL family metal-binding regulatory protein [Steroidobacter flavus]|uniref:CopL family metal-binding regulatory protein n=1 Tax=Steroidobacter flavus TaxID=1842136 RepID=A0ABV8SLE6_9GAMM